MPSRRVLLGAMFLQICYMYRKIKKRRTRRWKTRPCNANRRNYESQQQFSKNLREMSEEEFFHYIGIPRATFELLVNMSFKELWKGRQLVPPDERLCLTLQFLAFGERMETLAIRYKIGKTTARNIILETCRSLWRILAPIYINNSTEEQYTNIAENFKTLWNVPNCVGAIDAKHIPIRCPTNTREDKKVNSILLMGVCDTNYIFTAVGTEITECQNDGARFKNCSFGIALTKETLPLPSNKPLYQETSFAFPFYFVDNAVFPLRKNVMRPYPNMNLDQTRTIFNYRISRAHCVIENAFGILAARWKVLSNSMVFRPENCETIALACVVLHNFMMSNDSLLYCPHYYADCGDLNNGLWRDDLQRAGGPLKSITSFARRGPTKAVPLRDILARYFVNEGSIPSQQKFTADELINICE